MKEYVLFKCQIVIIKMERYQKIVIHNLELNLICHLAKYGSCEFRRKIKEKDMLPRWQKHTQVLFD